MVITGSGKQIKQLTRDHSISTQQSQSELPSDNGQCDSSPPKIACMRKRKRGEKKEKKKQSRSEREGEVYVQRWALKNMRALWRARV